MSNVLVFSRAHDKAFLRRHARRMASFRPKQAEGHLVRLLDQQRGTLRRRGITEDVIKAELAAIEGGIRGELWKVVLLRGGTA
ncbi:DUF6074 family protein [Bosea sp. UC22_33]|uniref:DUF6074 family protein n=1 Tax=Bosea sp. UC22_33 TaxID=3350165 RepID=UPI00366D57BE